MTVGGLSLDGNAVEFMLFGAMFALLVVMFLIGQLYGLKSRGTEEQSIEALRQARANELAEIEELRAKREAILKDGLRAQDALDRWEAVRRDHENLEAMRQELEEFEREESKRIDELELRRAEAGQRLREIQAALDPYPPEMTGSESAWKELLAERMEAYDKLRQATEDAQKEYAVADARRSQAEDEAGRLESKRERLNDETKEAQELLERIKQEQTDTLKPQNERLLGEVNQLKDQMEDLNKELTGRQKRLAETNEALNHATTELAARRGEMPDGDTDASSEEKLSAFRITPDSLLGYKEMRAETTEDDLLTEFEITLKDLGLRYPGQIIRAFHTALKVNDLSPLTVLSGLSGTGKSQLPRAYARFFGIHFLHVPVEPGWDSPQDILGFYDFVAERYRPTDRARALGRFDKKFAQDIGIEPDRDWDERMLIILLDEMNLARTEYYFSEFLSRLEMRGPRVNGHGDWEDREDAQIAIDLPYAENERPKHLYVPHNVLWVGTLNEDETTQALSDKVLDRANSIRFAPPEPGTLREHSAAPEHGVEEAAGYLPYKRWLEWSDRQTTVVAGAQQVDETLEELAKLMQSAGRGFGYRIAQSIKAYIQRYPGQDWRIPMIDQINMRLLPKLAGSEMSDCQETVDGLRRLSEDTLGDPDFAEALQDAATASQASQIFTWPGYTY